jgi:hypothetical protein
VKQRAGQSLLNRVEHEAAALGRPSVGPATFELPRWVAPWFRRLGYSLIPEYLVRDCFAAALIHWSTTEIGIVHDRSESVMYMTDNAPANGAQSINRRGDGEVVRQDRILAVEDEAPSPEAARERLPCAKSALGIDPRRTDFRGRRPVGRRLRPTVRRPGSSGRRQQGNTVTLTLPGREASYDLRA